MKKHLSIILSIVTLTLCLAGATVAFADDEFTSTQCEHIIETKVEPAVANTDQDGYRYNYCPLCGEVFDESYINAPSDIKLSNNSYKYDGNEKCPGVTVYDNYKNIIPADNYDVTYSDNVNIGIANVSVVFKNDYTGTLEASFPIKPSKTAISSVKYKSTGKIVVKWKKNSVGDGYIVQYSPSSKFPITQTCTVMTNKKVLSKTICNLPKRTYYVRVATYKSSKGYKVCGEWSTTKKIKIKNGVSLKAQINSTKTDLSGRKMILKFTKQSVDIKKYKTTYDRIKAIYDWHSKYNTKYFSSCMDCNMNFNICLYYLYGPGKQYDQFIQLAAGSFKNSNGTIVEHKWSVVYIQGVPYIFDPRLQGYTSDYKGTTYFGVTSSALKKKYLFEYWMFTWCNGFFETIV